MRKTNVALALALGLILPGCTTYFQDNFEHDAVGQAPVTPNKEMGKVVVYAGPLKEIVVRQTAQLTGAKAMELRSSPSGDGNFVGNNAFDYPPANVHFYGKVSDSKKRVWISWSQKNQGNKLTRVTVLGAAALPLVDLLVTPQQVTTYGTHPSLVKEFSGNEDRHELYIIIDPAAKTYVVKIDDVAGPGFSEKVLSSSDFGANGTITPYFDLRFANIGTFVSDTDAVLVDDIKISQENK